jgi:biotin transporter BioY
MRFVLAFISVIVLGYAVITLFFTPNDVISNRILKKERSWVRLWLSFFTGELLSDYFGFSVLSYIFPSKEDADNETNITATEVTAKETQSK